MAADFGRAMPRQAAGWHAAAAALRLPYWDWASEATVTKGVPDFFVQASSDSGEQGGRKGAGQGPGGQARGGQRSPAGCTAGCRQVACTPLRSALLQGSLTVRSTRSGRRTTMPNPLRRVMHAR